MSVVFHQLVPVGLKNRRQLKAFIHDLFTQEGKSLELLSIVFCSDDYLLEINKTHLQHDFYTDIITFDLSEFPKAAISGELYISVDRVKENASSQRVSLTEEFLRVIFHGSLHLCGFKDKSTKDIKLMRMKEDEYLKLYLL